MIHDPCLSYCNTITTPIPLAEDRLILLHATGYIFPSLFDLDFPSFPGFPWFEIAQKTWKTRKIWYIFFHSAQTTNSHNRFFFFCLYGFTSSPDNLLTSILRTFCEHILSPPQKVRRNPLQDHFSLKINTPFLITQMAEVALVTETFRHSATSATCRFRVPQVK